MGRKKQEKDKERTPTPSLEKSEKKQKGICKHDSDRIKYCFITNDFLRVDQMQLKLLGFCEIYRCVRVTLYQLFTELSPFSLGLG